MIEPERIQVLNTNSVQSGKYVLYWMQSSQRVEYNHALGYAIEKANEYGVPLLSFFSLTADYPMANERSYTFLLEGLKDMRRSLNGIGASLVIDQMFPDEGIVSYAKDAVLVVVDRDYQRLQRDWRSRVAKRVHCPVIQVETNVVVPVELASPKEEYTAGTFRPKVHKHFDRFLETYKLEPLEHTKEWVEVFDIENIPSILHQLNTDSSVKSVDWLHGGHSEAVKQLHSFIQERLNGFDEYRNDPSRSYLSNMSPYLHFGQISPIEIALAVMESGAPGEESYLEELIVRRELSMNFVHYNQTYDSIECLPNWARTTLDEHREDTREHVYSLKKLEQCETHDPYWNAAQKEMMDRGKMHGYMRMYWGKKIIEWSKTPEQAYKNAIYLNDKYELDGRDPNGYTGVAWCFGKHDRAWAERPIFGKIRYMNDKGLKRKFDIESYARQYGF